MMSELKIIINDDLEVLQTQANDLFYLLEWFDFDVFYFKIEFIREKYIALTMFKPMKLTNLTLMARKQNRETRLKKKPELKQQIQEKLDVFYPKGIPVMI